MPKADGETIRPGLGHLKQVAVYTTCGASWWLTRIVGAPGRRTLTRGIGFLAPKAKKSFAAHYLMDSSTDASRAKHLARIAAKVDKLVSR
jgi:putative NADPH-quinone reductase